MHDISLNNIPENVYVKNQTDYTKIQNITEKESHKVGEVSQRAC